ncbi:tRNA(Met) cytidine acetyltransferase [Salinimonas marina]|uniref:tRNA(Met) cytidine acetyltransferase n=1 Tax=Salinimonas marina TaxID=2785918 RepID=A0A7S9HC93_9ALTE|nr:GNAT family N-acetyltransferase [Salinimonas marina]QPG04879.1 tRNA(Met) cytidine acetyltransferase [Salinimonas marina]
MALANLQRWLQRHSFVPQAHRQLLLLSGEKQWVMQQITALGLAETLPGESCWLGTKPTHLCVSKHRELPLFRQLLGQEFEVAIFNGFDGLRPNALLAIAGTVKRGGTLIMLLPDIADWPAHPSVTQPHFLSYGSNLSHSAFTKSWLAQLIDDPAVARFSRETVQLPVVQANISKVDTFVHPQFHSPDQLQAWHQVIKISDTDTRHCVITAPRGRGKSALLALLAWYWHQQGKTVWLTSPVQHSQQVFYETLTRYSDAGFAARESIVWLAPDNPALVHDRPDILLIDEAAGLPLPVLNTLVDTHQRCILSTTTMGFEGSGLGFIHRFVKPRTNAKTLAEITLTTPLRWYSDDPLEAVLCNTLLPALPSPAHTETTNVQCELLVPARLSVAQRDAVFSLLALAHYQTTPDDLMRLHDAPDSLLLVATANETIVGAIAISTEGGQTLAAVDSQIAQGRRRVNGHLCAQSLALLSTESQLAVHTYWRISRIAVAEKCRQQGIARDMLTQLEAIAARQEVDWLATSFGLTPSLLTFWHKVGFEQVKTGEKPDKASGQPSALCLKPLSGKALPWQLKLRWLYQFDTQQPVSASKASTLWLRQVMKNRLHGYLASDRPRQHMGATFNLLARALGAAVLQQTPLFYALYVQQHSIQTVIGQHRLKGRKMLEQALRNELQAVAPALYTAAAEYP